MHHETVALGQSGGTTRQSLSAGSMLDPIGTKRHIDTDEDAAKRQRSQEEQAAALGQLPGVAALAFAPLAHSKLYTSSYFRSRLGPKFC